MKLKNFNHIQYLQQKIIDKLVPLIQSDYVLLDVPNHGNIGDHLIYEGELLFLDNYVNKYVNQYSANAQTFISSKIKENNTILLHGGGNFGDIYHLHQNFRLDIIQKYPNNRIIILPQTVFYQNQDNLIADCKILDRHQDLYICVRDTLSYNLLSQYLGEEKLLLLPDMAFFIDFTNYVKSDLSRKALLMFRLDVESTGSPDKTLVNDLCGDGYTVDIKDWPTYYNTFNVKRYNLYNRFRATILKLLSNTPIINRTIQPDTNDLFLKNHYIKMGVDFMNQYDLVYTTRLHGLILAILLDKKIVALDNSYGKLSSFYYTWLNDFDNIILNSNK